MEFTITDFRKMFPDNDACLEAIMHIRYGKLKHCPNCKKETKFHRVKKRTCYECQWCGYQIYPMKGTIFEKSVTPLSLWFYAIYLMTATRSGVSAKELQRQLGVTYKTAWRIAHQIRSLMGSDFNSKLSGKVEIDDTYVGGKGKGKRGRGADIKTPVLGILERKGDVKGHVIRDVKKKTVMPLIKADVLPGSHVNTDEYQSYRSLEKEGYFHDYVRHVADEYVKGDCHIQSIEGFWSRLKNSISGTHIWVSGKYLQNYVNEFAFRYNQRENGNLMFFALLDCLSKPYEAIH